jgi:hypothetical protein
VVWSPGFSRQGVDNIKRVKKFYAPFLSCAAPPEGGTPNFLRSEHGTAPEAFEALRQWQCQDAPIPKFKLQFYGRVGKLG